MNSNVRKLINELTDICIKARMSGLDMKLEISDYIVISMQPFASDLEFEIDEIDDNDTQDILYEVKEWVEYALKEIK